MPLPSLEPQVPPRARPGTPERLKLLVVGTLPPPVGGCSVTLKTLVDLLAARDDVDLRVLDTGGIRGRGLRGAARLAAVTARLVRLAREADVVSLHVATSALPSWGTVVAACARLAGKPLVVRKFAGTDYLRRGRVSGLLSDRVVRASDAYLVETREHLDASVRRGLRTVHWFPTTRPLRAVAAAPAAGGACRRFVYLGHVRRNKGIPELVAAMRRLPQELTLDVYGPWFDDLPPDVFRDVPRVTVHGPVAPEDVVPTLARYDAAVLPSLASTEGYPGVVLEAYAAGLPVIASRIGAIPEIVDPSVGVLVPPGDPAALADAMARLAAEPERWRALRAAARHAAVRFSSEVWAERFVGFCRDAAAAHGGAKGTR